MDGLEGLEGVKGDVEALEGFDLVLVTEDQPEEASEVDDLRWVVEQQLLVPVRVAIVLHQH